MTERMQPTVPITKERGVGGLTSRMKTKIANTKKKQPATKLKANKYFLFSALKASCTAAAQPIAGKYAFMAVLMFSILDGISCFTNSLQDRDEMHKKKNKK